MRLACAMLYVSDFPRMKAFCGEMLGTQAVNTESTESWALFETNGTRIGLHARDGAMPSPPPVRETGPVKLIFTVEDVPAERTRLESMGVTMLQRTWQQPAEACDGIDPEGNVFQISAAWLYDSDNAD